MISAKDKIKKAIFHLVSSKPFKDVTTEEIIAEAQVAKASFYYYFKDKYEATIEVFEDKILTPVTQAKENDGKSWNEKIVSIYAKASRHKDFMSNLLENDKIVYFYLTITKFYFRQLMKYLKQRGADVEQVLIKKSAQNLAQTGMLVLYQYAQGKITNSGLNMLADVWSETVPHALYNFVI